MKKRYKISIMTLLLAILINAIYYYKDDIYNYVMANVFPVESYEIKDLPEYDGQKYVIINNNEPEFDDADKTTKSFEKYSNLDYLGRCKKAYANVSIDTMPTEKRTSIGMIKPSGWHTVKYDFVDGKFLYNRCHLIGFQLTAENANKNNLITCTRQMNTGVMLEYENKVANYVKKTNNHVLYRVTPIFDGKNLVATGVQMEGYSVEDNGKGIKFNIFVYNVQDGIKIDYSNGNSWISK